MSWVTIDYVHQSSNAKVRYTKRTEEIKPYEWKMMANFRPANELEIRAEEESRLLTQPPVWDWREHEDIQWLSQWTPLKVLIDDQGG